MFKIDNFLLIALSLFCFSSSLSALSVQKVKYEMSDGISTIKPDDSIVYENDLTGPAYFTLASAVSMLKPTGFLTQDRFEQLKRHAEHATSIAKILTLFSPQIATTEDNFNRLINNARMTPHILDTLQGMYPRPISQDVFSVLIDMTDANDIRNIKDGLKILLTYGLFSLDNARLLRNNPYEISSGLFNLTFSDDNFSLKGDPALQYYYLLLTRNNRQASTLGSILSVLKLGKVLNPGNANLLEENIRYIAQIQQTIDYMPKPLSQDNFNFTIKHVKYLAQINSVFDLIYYDCNTKENFQILMTHINHISSIVATLRSSNKYRFEIKQADLNMAISTAIKIDSFDPVTHNKHQGPPGGPIIRPARADSDEAVGPGDDN